MLGGRSSLSSFGRLCCTLLIINHSAAIWDYLPRSSNFLLSAAFACSGFTSAEPTISRFPVASCGCQSASGVLPLRFYLLLGERMARVAVVILRGARRLHWANNRANGSAESAADR